MDEAIPNFEKALEGDPDYGEIHANLAGALLEKGRFDDAIPHFEKSAGRQSELGQTAFRSGTAVGDAREV